MDESDKKKSLIVFRLKIFYWIMVLPFSVAFAYLSGIGFRAANLHNQRVEAIVFGLIYGSFLVYFNIFHTHHNFSERLISSLVYLFCLSTMAYIYKPLLYDSSSYRIIGRIRIWAPAAFMAMAFVFYIWGRVDDE
jgi:hypothetical protein